MQSQHASSYKAPELFPRKCIVGSQLTNGGIGWSGDSVGEPQSGSFPAEGWLFIIGTLARSKRNGGFIRADYATFDELSDYLKIPKSTLYKLSCQQLEAIDTTPWTVADSST